MKTVFGRLKIGERFRLAELPGRGRPAHYVKTSTRAYQTRTGERIETRRTNLAVVKL